MSDKPKNDPGDETRAPKVGDQVRYFSAEDRPNADVMDRFTPRLAFVSEVIGDRYDVLVVASRSDSKAMLEPLRIERNCSFYAKKEVIGNRRGDGGWDWSATGQKFIAFEKPTVIPREAAPKAIAPVPVAPVGPAPVEAKPAKAIIQPPGFVPEPPPAPRHPPIHATGRVKPKEGVTLEA
jgi:hypothetical protein